MQQLTKSTTGLWLFVFSLFALVSCKKDLDSNEAEQQAILTSAAKVNGHLKQTKTYSADVALKWLHLQMQILRLSGATPQTPAANPYSLNGNRNFAYLGVALYEAVVPGMPSYQSLSGQLTDMPKMPETEPGKAYHWPTSANAALAFLTTNFYAAAPAMHKQAMLDLENSLQTEYRQQTDAAIFERSNAFGLEVAKRIFAWAQEDGSQKLYDPWVAPSDPTKWSNTAPNPTGVSAPFWGLNRAFVPGSFNNTASPPPPAYSTDPNSAYYKMVKEVYDISQTLTDEQKATALYFRDNPGFQAGTNYQFTFTQIMHDENPQLDELAVAQAKVGIILADAQINCWKIKYTLLVDRPIRYIRNVLGHTTWNSFLAMPPHPDFPSGHSQTGGAFAAAMTSLLGDNYHFTLHTYDILNMAPRPYKSFNEMADDIGQSRVYGGIHYTYSCVEGIKQGSRIAANILTTLRFQK
ncbi:MAG: vanadium-dependent haloperoxidase [Bacteroidota bacterium]|nr:vanadium-dependent haloperoxidase [Bacteroidota bacterium]